MFLHHRCGHRPVRRHHLGHQRLVGGCGLRFFLGGLFFLLRFLLHRFFRCGGRLYALGCGCGVTLDFLRHGLRGRWCLRSRLRRCSLLHHGLWWCCLCGSAFLRCRLCNRLLRCGLGCHLLGRRFFRRGWLRGFFHRGLGHLLRRRLGSLLRRRLRGRLGGFLRSRFRRRLRCLLRWFLGHDYPGFEKCPQI